MSGSRSRSAVEHGRQISAGSIRTPGGEAHVSSQWQLARGKNARIAWGSMTLRNW
jgi:hypothetical protein